MTLTQVQRWVMSSLAVVTIFHLAGTFSLAAIFSDPAKLDARIGLNVIAALTGMIGMAAGRLIHQKSPLTPWLLFGLLPAAVGTWITFA